MQRKDVLDDPELRIALAALAFHGLIAAGTMSPMSVAQSAQGNKRVAREMIAGDAVALAEALLAELKS